MKLSDDLKNARIAIEAAMREEGLRADGRVRGAGRSYGVESHWRDEIPLLGDGKKARKRRK